MYPPQYNGGENQRNVHTNREGATTHTEKSRFENCVQTLSQTVASYDAKITNIEQMVNSLATRVTTLETNLASASSGSGSASSWNFLGQKVMAPLPLDLSGPKTTETQDADLILFQAQVTNMHEVPSYFNFYVNNTTLELLIGSITSGQRPTYLSTTNLSGFIAKRVVYPPDSYSRRELNVKTSWPGTRMMVSVMQWRAHFAFRVPISLSAVQIARRPGNRKTSCAPVESFGRKAQRDDTGTFIVPALNVRSQVFSTKDRRNGVGKTNLLHLDTNRCLVLLLLTCAFLAFLMTYCDKSLCKQDIWLRMARSMCDDRPFASSPLRRLASRGPPLRGVPVWWTMRIAIYLIRSFILQVSVHCHRGCSQHQCSRPHDTLTCLFFTSPYLSQGRSILTQTQQTKDINMA